VAKTGGHRSIARFTTNPQTSDNNYQNYSDGAVTDASFIRLKNLSLSYSFPQAMLKKTAITSTKFFIRGENLFLFTKYKGPDPETQNFYVIPTIRVITAGISVTF